MCVCVCVRVCVCVNMCIYDYLPMQEPQGQSSGDKLEKKLKSLMSEVDTLKNEVYNIMVTCTLCVRVCVFFKTLEADCIM